MNTYDPSRERFCSASPERDRRNLIADLSDTLEMILPYAVTAPAWAVEAALAAIKEAKGQS